MPDINPSQQAERSLEIIRPQGLNKTQLLKLFIKLPPKLPLKSPPKMVLT